MDRISESQTPGENNRQAGDLRRDDAELHRRIVGETRLLRLRAACRNSALDRKIRRATVPIRNARTVVGELSLDNQGFELTHQETAVRDFYDQDEVKGPTIPKSNGY